MILLTAFVQQPVIATGVVLFGKKKNKIKNYQAWLNKAFTTPSCFV